MFYILNETGRVVRTATAPLDTAALKSAGYTVVESERTLSIDSVEVHGFPTKPTIVEKRSQVLPEIALTTTAMDTDGDGLPEIPADGKSKTSLHVTLRDTKGTILKKSIEVYFRTTAGTLSHREIMTDHGKAVIELTASRETVTAILCAFAEGFTPAYLKFEFVPEENQNA
jgi:hypothetical protein